MREYLYVYRRLIYTAVFLITLLIIITRVYFFANITNDEIDYKDTTRSFLDTLLSTIFVTGSISVWAWWIRISPGSAIEAGIEILPRDISSELEKVARDADEWEYVGHTGRYVRARIFPILLESAIKNNKLISIR